MKLPFIPAPSSNSTLQKYEDKMYADYDHEKTVNDTAAKKLNVPASVNTFFTNIIGTKYTAKAVVKRESVKLVLNISSSTVRDRKEKASTKDKNWTDVDGDPNVTYDKLGGGLMVHGNVFFTLKGTSPDAIQEFNTVRDMRCWGKTKGSSEFMELQPWHDDCVGKRTAWEDLPGALYPTNHKSANLPSERYLCEFLYAVRKFPEFGMRYYYVLLDVKPRFYRIHVAPSINVSKDKWNQIHQSKTPWNVTEAVLDSLVWKRLTLPQD